MISKETETFQITRDLDSPRQVVFEAWTKPEHVTKWCGRKGFTMTSCTMDFRTGGEFRYCWRAPAGQHFCLRLGSLLLDPAKARSGAYSGWADALDSLEAYAWKLEEQLS